MKIVLLLVFLSTVAWCADRPAEEVWEPPVRRAVQPQATKIPAEKTELDLLVDVSISAYRFIVSDQQGDVCAFTPSCSEYAQEALHAHGYIFGALMAADRLERCNRSAWRYTPRYYRAVLKGERPKLADPVSSNSPRGNGGK